MPCCNGIFLTGTRCRSRPIRPLCRAHEAESNRILGERANQDPELRRHLDEVNAFERSRDAIVNPSAGNPMAVVKPVPNPAAAGRAEAPARSSAADGRDDPAGDHGQVANSSARCIGDRVDEGRGCGTYCSLACS